MFCSFWCILVTSWFESRKCTNKPTHYYSPNILQYRRNFFQPNGIKDFKMCGICWRIEVPNENGIGWSAVLSWPHLFTGIFEALLIWKNLGWSHRLIWHKCFFANRPGGICPPKTYVLLLVTRCFYQTDDVHIKQPSFHNKQQKSKYRTLLLLRKREQSGCQLHIITRLHHILVCRFIHPWKPVISFLSGMSRHARRSPWV